MLRELEAFPEHRAHDDEPWHTLWSSLCHQYGIFPASFAAVPHIVRIALTDPLRACIDYIMLPTSIEACRLSCDPQEVPESLSDAYFAAIAKLPGLVTARLGDDWDGVFARVATSALCAAKGHGKLAHAILDLSDDILEEFPTFVAAEFQRQHPPTRYEPPPLPPPGTTFTA